MPIAGPNPFERSPLHEAARVGDLDAARALIQAFAAAGDDANPPDAVGWTPLHECAAVDGPEIARLLLEAGATVRVLTPDNWSPLQVAAVCGAPSTAEVLLAAGADPRARDAAGKTPLAAAGEGWVDPVTRALLERA